MLTGGDGADIFIFDMAAAANNSDTIVDFKVSDGDEIHLKWDVFRLGSANQGHALTDAQFFSGSPTTLTSAATRIIYEKTGNTARLWYDGDGSATRFDAKLIATFWIEAASRHQTPHHLRKSFRVKKPRPGSSTRQCGRGYCPAL